MKKISLLLFSLLSLHSFAYVIGKSDNGKNIKWNSQVEKIAFFVNTTPVSENITLDISDEQLRELNLTATEYISKRTRDIIEESLLQWNSITPMQIIPFYQANSQPLGVRGSSFRYSNNISYFGAGVIAVTSIQYDANSGELISTDILLNQSTLSSTKLSLDKSISSDESAYIGDVITHELGHLLGLSHSEVVGSSMVSSVFKGQYDIHKDDIAGVQKNYSMSSKKGSLRGRVVAGGEGLAVFGVNIQVLSAKTNQVVQSQLSDERGVFFLEGLDLEQSYYVLVSPLKQLESVPEYYKNVNNKICFQGDFKSTFFSKCGPRDRGRPQVFYLGGSSDYLDIGDITIRCDENLNTNYFANKFKTSNRQFELLRDRGDENTLFTGFFSEEEILSGEFGAGDEFTIDYRGLDLSDIDTTNLVVNIELTAVGIGSVYGFLVYAKLMNDATWTKYTFKVDNATGKKITDLSIQMNLSIQDSDNLVEVKVFPVKLSSTEEYEIFASRSALSNKNNLYTILARAGYYSDLAFSPLVKYDSYPYDDNQTCVEGSLNYASLPFTPFVLERGAALRDNDSSEDEGLGISCGSIDNIESGGGGMGSFILSFALMLLLLRFNNIFYNPLSKS